MLRTVARVTAVGAAIAVPIGAYAFLVRPWARTWGVDETEAATMLPGDDIVPDATTVETRAITIDADPSDVWPWLLQMGYGKAGFYSYDRFDQKGVSADEIVPEWQTLDVGGSVPTNPAGGFEVRVFEPQHALVLYVDDKMTADWAMKSGAEAGDAGETHADDTLGVAITADAKAKAARAMPAGVRTSGAMLGSTMPKEFAGTWTFFLQRTPEGATRLIERMRFHFPLNAAQPGQKFAMNALGFGVFLMVRKQLLGIRDRAERLAATKLPSAPTAAWEAPAPA